jgi:rubrerythrin
VREHGQQGEHEMARLGRIGTFDEESGGTLVRSQRKDEHPQREWECTVCGYVREGRRPPTVCPECGADEDDFELWEYEDEDWDDEDWD